MSSRLKLIRATRENGVFLSLKNQWISQISPEEDADYYSALMAHAESVAMEIVPDKKYGIFVLKRGEEPEVSYEAFVHINHAPLHPDGPVLRMVWNLLAPKYDQNDTSDEQVAEFAASFIYEGLELCRGDMRSKEVRIYLHNATDIRYARGISSALRHSGIDVAVRGSWMHIKI